MSQYPELSGKVAIVTGAGRPGGLGSAIAQRLAQEGAKVVVADLDTVQEMQAVVQEIIDHGGQAMALPCNMLNGSAVEKLVADTQAAYGGVDILINNAGGSRSFKDLHVSEAQWQEAMTLNFHRPRQLADALIDQMIANRWGRIINITGKSEPDHVNGAFCAKAGMHSWAKGLSRMVGPHGITVNCVPPGRIHSEQIFRNYTPEYRQWQCENEIPMARYGEPEDMANLVTFLASPRASYITGAVIPVDGGLRRYQF